MFQYVKISCNKCKLELTRPNTLLNQVKHTIKGDFLINNFFVSRILYTNKTEIIDYILYEKVKCSSCGKKIGHVIQSVPTQCQNLLEYIKLIPLKVR
jgi:hypothetical protein